MFFVLRQLPRGEALERMAERLGVSREGTLFPSGAITNEPELQRRVQEALRSRRDSWMWLLAFVSALASAASAFAAWLAVLTHSR